RQRLQNRVSRHAVALQQLRGRRAPALVGNRDEQMLGADELVLQPIGFRLRLIGDELEARAHAGFRSSVRLRQLFQQLARAARAAAAGSTSISRRSSGTMPSRRSTSATSRCSGSSCGLLAARASSTAAATASRAFSVYLLMFIASCR